MASYPLCRYSLEYVGTSEGQYKKRLKRHLNLFKGKVLCYATKPVFVLSVASDPHVWNVVPRVLCRLVKLALPKRSISKRGSQSRFLENLLDHLGAGHVHGNGAESLVGNHRLDNTVAAVGQGEVVQGRLQCFARCHIAFDRCFYLAVDQNLYDYEPVVGSVVKSYLIWDLCPVDGDKLVGQDQGLFCDVLILIKDIEEGK